MLGAEETIIPSQETHRVLPLERPPEQKLMIQTQKLQERLYDLKPPKPFRSNFKASTRSQASNDVFKRPRFESKTNDSLDNEPRQVTFRSYSPKRNVANLENLETESDGEIKAQEDKYMNA